MIYTVHEIYSPWNSPGENTGMGSCSLLQRIFSIQRSNPGLPHCRQILYHPSHQGSPIQFSSVAQSCQTLCDPVNCSTPGLLSITNSQSSPKPMSIESVMPYNHLILCLPFSSCPQSFPASGSFQMSQLFASGGQSIGISASTSVLPVNTQDWSPLGWTGWISLQFKGLSRVFSNTTVQKHQFFGTQLSL